ncbi:FtsX-like permease family protein [Nocardioides hwasunensis]|uniref:FtsX-like permease family protein n=1 Tax=Nocardioides hwasunensis TaxID=397258 RepID=A0ABR8MPD9_9ACTN|nr:ABC transporter permease [Nocardioides hwasunensis]MBD3916680.1 FtsX-like permease family protein [Nocardioides hwasunensis]
MSGWRPALRIAWRDALRHRGRSILVLVMISLPVLAVSATAIVIKTAEVSGLEGVDRTLGAADARVRTEGRGEILQAPDPGSGTWTQVGDVDADDPITEDDLRAVLGDDARLVPITSTWSRARVGERVVFLTTTGVDLADPLAAPLFALDSGHLPRTAGEAVVNQATLDRGLAMGDEVNVGGEQLTIVGVGRDATLRDEPLLLASADDLPSEAANVREWLVGAGPVTWSQVRELNGIGGVVTSRAVLADPPELPQALEDAAASDSGRNQAIAVIGLIVVMALIEVVLLAGPAFAVGARRHSRTLALIAASGGTPAQARRVILGSGVVLGLVASFVGLLLGGVLGWAVLPLAQRFDERWFGPFELPWPYLAAIVAFGLASAFLASVVPAYLASRQDVVAVLAGRRGDRSPRASTPVIGLVMLVLGIVASVYGALTSDSGDGGVWIAASAVISVLGMVLVVPVVVAAIARLSSRLPLTARYAARDAARHRTRTVPAVAAVAATVAGVVALGIANASDELENVRTYQAQAPMGSGYVSWAPEVLTGEELPDATAAWARIEEAVHRAAPDVRTTTWRGLDEPYDPHGYTSTMLESRGDRAAQEALDECCLRTLGAAIAVADSAAELGVQGPAADAIDAALSSGRAVVFTVSADLDGDVAVTQETWSADGDLAESRTSDAVPAAFIAWDGQDWGWAPSSSILPTVVADELGLDVTTTSLRLSGDLDEATETRIAEQVEGAAAGTYTYVERGYERAPYAFIVLLVLAVLAGVLMLGGTLTATFLALSDARPDLATLSAVGAAPRTRRRVAAAYALVIGFVGALLGAGVGFIPGVAISRPLTSVPITGAPEQGPFLDIPWLLIGVIVLALPLLTAAIVGLTARSRLPLVARLD